MLATSGELLNVDVFDGLARVADGSIDLIVADPPYGIAKSFGRRDSWDGIEGWKEWCGRWLAECCRALGDHGSIMVYGIHNYLCFNQVQLYELGMQYRRQIIWHYDNGFCGNRNMRATYEPMLWFSKGEDCYFEEIREPYRSADRLKYEIKKNGKVWRPNPNGRLAGDVWQIPTLAGRRFRDERVDHPTQKPLVLSERIVRHFCPRGGTVLVPFAGSGSECLAAYRHGRAFLGIEINPAYCGIARQRLLAEGWKPNEQLQNNVRIEVSDSTVLS